MCVLSKLHSLWGQDVSFHRTWVVIPNVDRPELQWWWWWWLHNMLQPRLLPAQSLSTRERLSCAKFPLTAHFLQFAIFDALAISASVRNVLYQNVQLVKLQRRGTSKTWSFGRSDQTKLNEVCHNIPSSTEKLLKLFGSSIYLRSHCQNMDGGLT